jgi:tRNA 2-thiouridine synthesizing protein C
MKLAFVFTQSPFSSSAAREGLDALLAATAFVDESDIGAFFIDDGILNLVPQQPHLLLQKDHLAGFKLLQLYEIEQCYSAKESWQRFAFDPLKFEPKSAVIKTDVLSFSELMQKLSSAEKILTF